MLRTDPVTCVPIEACGTQPRYSGPAQLSARFDTPSDLDGDDKWSCDATVLGGDPAADLAVIKLDNVPGDLKVISLQHCCDKLRAALHPREEKSSDLPSRLEGLRSDS